MNVRLVTPTTERQHQDLAKVIAEGSHGRFCILPRHTDFLGPLIPGVLTLVEESGEVRFFANDYGLLVKRGREVQITTRRVISGQDLGQLREAVANRIQQTNQTEQAGIAAAASLEANFVRRLLEMQ